MTGPLLAPLMRMRFFVRLQILTHPLVAFPLWAANLFLWHLPVLYESALHSPATQVLEHLCLLVFGINMWMCLLGPLPVPRWFGNAAKLGYIVAVRLTAAALANVFLWSDTVFYPYFIHRDLVRNISPLADQNVAGAVMLIGDSVLTLGLLVWLFVHTLKESEEPNELAEIARASGLPLGDAYLAKPPIAATRSSEHRGRFQQRPERVVAPQQPPG